MMKNLGILSMAAVVCAVLFLSISLSGCVKTTDVAARNFTSFYTLDKERMCCADCLKGIENVSYSESDDCIGVSKIKGDIIQICLLVFDNETGHPHTIAQCRQATN